MPIVPGPNAVERLRREFDAEHLRLYGHCPDSGSAIEVVAVRLVGRDRAAEVSLPAVARQAEAAGTPPRAVFKALGDASTRQPLRVRRWPSRRTGRCWSTSTTRRSLCRPIFAVARGNRQYRVGKSLPVRCFPVRSCRPIMHTVDPVTGEIVRGVPSHPRPTKWPWPCIARPIPPSCATRSIFRRRSATPWVR